jgi:hypothetical protein
LAQIEEVIAMDTFSLIAVLSNAGLLVFTFLAKWGVLGSSEDAFIRFVWYAGTIAFVLCIVAVIAIIKLCYEKKLDAVVSIILAAVGIVYFFSVMKFGLWLL